MKKVLVTAILMMQTVLFAQTTQQINKPLVLNSVANGAKNDSILVRGADKVVKYVKRSELSSASYFVKTKAQIDALIASNGLIPNALYEIHGVHPSLYNDGTNSGTTIYLKAVTNNTLEKQGYGDFWNPKYNQTPDGSNEIYNGVWNNRSKWVSYDLRGSSIQPIFANLGTNAHPAEIISDSLGNLYTTNSATLTVQKITPAGVVSTYGTTGAQPLSLAFDSLGNLFVTNYSANTISKITPDGTSSIFATTGGTGAASITIDSDNNLYVVNYTSNNVTKITPLGVSTILATTGGTGSSSIVIDSTGNLFISCTISKKIIKITTSGISTVFATLTGSPYDLAIDKNDNIFAPSYDDYKIYKITPLGSLSVFTTGLYDKPYKIFIDNKNYVYVSNAGSSSPSTKSVTKINPDGTFRDIMVITYQVSGMYVNDAGTVYTANYNDNNISKATLIYFTEDELINFSGRATGKLFKSIYATEFILLTGSLTYYTGLNFVGSVSGAVGTVSGATVTKSFPVGSKTIYGGYAWVNTNGGIGTNIIYINDHGNIYPAGTDPYNLYESWSKLPYTSTDYNRAIDVIEYDYENDYITRRYEVESNNDVVFTKGDAILPAGQLGDVKNAISAFQFGNKANYNSGQSVMPGIKNVSVYHSYFENVNFCGLAITDVNLISNSSIYANEFAIGSTIESLSLDNSRLSGNYLIGTYTYYNTYFKDLNLKNSAIDNIELIGATFNDSYLNNSIVSNFSIYSDVVNYRKQFALNDLTNTTIDGQNVVLENKSLFRLNSKGCTINNLTGTILFGDYDKTAFRRLDGTTKLKYYNNSNVEVIANTTD